MDKITRRGLIKQASVGAATVGTLMAVPGLSKAYASTALESADQKTASMQGSLVAHVRNVSTGEIALLVGTREIVIRDPDLVKRLLKAAQ